MSKPVFEDIFTPSGRRNRQSYILFILSTGVLYLILLALYYGLFALWGEPALRDLNTLDPPTYLPWVMRSPQILEVILSIVPGFVIAQRLRDFGWSGWVALLAIIPFSNGIIGGLVAMVIGGFITLVGAIIVLALCFVPGDVGPNRYGPDPLGDANSQVPPSPSVPA
jgi:uncharacterized membrane protein YhaH (DUF805 family)